MELIRGIHNIKPRHHGCVLTIGNFDGVHLGHQQVLTQLLKQASRLKLPSTVMIFEPQPMEYFAKDNSPARLSRLRDKWTQLKLHQLDRLLCVRFNHHFAQLSADEFISQLLVAKLGVKFLVVGDDFCFGKGREGNFVRLQAAGKKYGFEVINTKTFDCQGIRISSTAIRDALARDDLNLSALMLGRQYSISGRVSHGRKLGRTIGFPTANIPLQRCVSPITGVYVVEVRGLSSDTQQSARGVANIGYRPTVNGKRQQLEVHIFNFSANLYGKQLEVSLLHKLRNEQKFATFDALKQQIQLDAEAARAWRPQLNHTCLTSPNLTELTINE